MFPGYEFGRTRPNPELHRGRAKVGRYQAPANAPQPQCAVQAARFGLVSRSLKSIPPELPESCRKINCWYSEYEPGPNTGSPGSRGEGGGV